MSGTQVLVAPDPAAGESASAVATLPPSASPEAPEPAARWSSIPHDCEDDTVRSAKAASRDGREIGIDVARALALLGMMVVHILPANDANGDITTAWYLAVGKSSALFAVLAGVGIALTTGRTRPPTGRRWWAAVSAILVRALLIGAIGLALGSVVSAEIANVILPYYALLFVLAVPFLRLKVGWLLAVAGLIAVAMPLVSHLARAGTPWVEPTNLTFVAALERPVETLSVLALTGAYPALPWLAYVCVGLAVGRTRLSMRGVAAGIALCGIVIALLARLGSWYLLGPLGGRRSLAEVATSSMSFQEYTELPMFGADGTLPADSLWWLAVLSPHTATPPDLLFTIGIALAVLGVAIMLGRVGAPLLAPLAVAGSMPLTLYATHLLLLVAPWMPQDSGLHFAVQVAVLLALALGWRRRFARGPLEQLVWWATDRTRRLVMRQRRRGAHVLVAGRA